MSKAPVRRWRVWPADWVKSMRMSARSARREDEAVELDGRGEEALVAADLGERLAVGEGEDEEAAVGGVEEAEAIEARLDLEEGSDLSVDEDAVGAELGDPGVLGIAGDGVEELAVGGEVAVVEDEGDFVLAAGEMEGVFDVIADEQHAEEAGVGVEAIEAHGVVVIPERGGVLLERVGADAGLAGDEPVFGVAVVFGGGLGAVKMGGGADVGDVVAAAMEGVVDGKEVLCGEVVDPLDLEGFAGAGFDERCEGSWAVAPHAGGGDVAMDLGVDLLHGDGEGAVAVLERGTDGFGEREGVDEGCEREGVEHRGPMRGGFGVGAGGIC